MSEVSVWIGQIDASASFDEAVRGRIGHALATDPAAISFDRRCAHCGHPTHGKPRVAGAPQLSFSVSHSGDFCALAVAFGVAVGVDVEVIRPRRYLDRLADRILTPRELVDWRAQPEPERLTAFLRHWTAREAYLKATGFGIVGGVRDALVAAEGWTIAPLDGLHGAVGAVAFEGEGRVTTAPWTEVP